jgi:hypothetical protein
MLPAPVISPYQRWLTRIDDIPGIRSDASGQRSRTSNRGDASGIRVIASISPATEDGQDRTQGFRKRQELDSHTPTSSPVDRTGRPRLSVSTAKPVVIFYN